MANLNEPVLPGTAASDYERYLRTDELLSLQKTPGEMSHRDELLFQTIHQTAELWLKLACFEVEAATERLERTEIWDAVRLLRRATQCLDLVTSGTLMLEHLAPWDYHGVRRSLGHGSGFDSPGFRELRRWAPALVQELHGILRERGLDLRALYVEGRDHEELYALSEALIELDERAQLWRIRHYQVVARVIGDQVVGTQGTPVEVLGRLVKQRFYPELWDVRNALTAHAKELE